MHLLYPLRPNTYFNVRVSVVERSDTKSTFNLMVTTINVTSNEVVIE